MAQEENDCCSLEEVVQEGEQTIKCQESRPAMKRTQVVMSQSVVPEEGDRENTVRTVECLAAVLFGDAVILEGERENNGEVAIKCT